MRLSSICLIVDLIVMSDQELINKYLTGDSEAIELLIKRYLKPVYGFSYRYVRNSEEAEDITQETFLKAWRNLKQFQKGKNFKTWLFTIAKNTAIDFIRKSRSASGGKRAVPFSFFDTADGENFLENVLPDPAPLASQLAERFDLQGIISRATHLLSAKHRTALALRYNDNMSFREIAETLGEPVHTIKSRHRRAIIKLKDLLPDIF